MGTTGLIGRRCNPMRHAGGETRIPGMPAKAVRQLTDDDIAAMHRNAETYAVRQAMYTRQLKRIDA